MHISEVTVKRPVFATVISLFLVLVGIVIWIGWHVVSNMQESRKMDSIARRRPGKDDWKSNSPDW